MTQGDKVIFLVRHCQDLPSDNMDAETASQVRLTKYGARQARALGRFLRRKKVDAVYSSIFQRSKETGEIIHSFTGGTYVIDDRLNEQVVARAQIGKLEAKELKQQMLDDPHFFPEGGQSLLQSINLFLQVIDEVSNSKYSRICIVSHAFLMQAALQRKFDLAIAPQLAEGSISILRVEGDILNLYACNIQPYTFLRLKEKFRKLLFY